jgi:16S rRNA (adenine1518-N6/adenine1519-N6)-dimethyltransferase
LVTADTLLGPAEIRDLAERLGLRPTKALGQSFGHDPNTGRPGWSAARWCSKWGRGWDR